MFPTILRYLGLPIPEGTQGQPLLEVDHPAVSELHYALDQMPARPRSAIASTARSGRSALGEHRYFQGSERRGAALPPPGADPRETQNLIAELPEWRRRRRAGSKPGCVRTAEAAPPAKPTQKLDPEALENLRALGYIR